MRSECYLCLLHPTTLTGLPDALVATVLHAGVVGDVLVVVLRGGARIGPFRRPVRGFRRFDVCGFLLSEFLYRRRWKVLRSHGDDMWMRLDAKLPECV